MNKQVTTDKAKLISLLQSLEEGSSKQTLNLVNTRSSHEQCMICGKSTHQGLRLDFYSDSKQQVWSYYQSSAHQQGYQGILHGGFISALLDGSMCQVLFNRGIEAVTADMNVRFIHEIPIDTEVVMTAKVINIKPPLYKVEAELYVETQIMAKSTARFFDKSYTEKKSA